MKAYYYTPEECGMKEFPSGLMRLAGFDITTDPKEASQRFDNMVIHGNDEDMVNVALMAAMKVLALNKVEIDGYDEGFDEDGKSHTEILANRVKAAVRERRKAAREAKG